MEYGAEKIFFIFDFFFIFGLFSHLYGHPSATMWNTMVGAEVGLSFKVWFSFFWENLIDSIMTGFCPGLYQSGSQATSRWQSV